MGNQASAEKGSSRSATASPASVSHTSTPTRREPRLPSNLQNQRVSAAPPAPSMAQARGTSASHRTRNSQSHPHNNVKFEEPSRSPTPKEQMKAPEKAPEKSAKMEIKTEPSKPVAVPMPTNNPVGESATLRSPYSFTTLDPDSTSYHLSRPPRLPLPIEEEIHTPGSPIIAPADVGAPDIETLGTDVLDSGDLGRKSSGLSSATVDEDLEDEELPIDKTKASVPIDIEWLAGGDKVYVTGSIFQWSRKSKLYPIPGRPGCFSAAINVRPGTHHVRFIVDGNMVVSEDLPTTVDFGNNLVNYIEVSADDVPRPFDSSNAMGTPVAEDEKKLAEQKDGKAEASTKRTKPTLPADRYTSNVPQYLIDLDKAEDTTAYQFAAAAIEKLPTPPSLPGFLGKPILNAATPMKDDNSVLNMPNHTVLNHLATSSIKNNVLAVSATTRYKKKYVTTIMYKPTGDDLA